MQFHLYEVTIQRQGHTVRGYIVAPSEDRAALVIIEHDEVLGLTHDDFSLERVDHTLEDSRQLGLDNLLRSAPVGFASFCDIGWIAHTAPVQQLKLYRTADRQGGSLFAVAPNIDIAASVFASALRVPLGSSMMLHISEGDVDLPDGMREGLSNLLELGPIGIAEFDAGEKRWIVR